MHFLSLRVEVDRLISSHLIRKHVLLVMMCYQKRRTWNLTHTTQALLLSLQLTAAVLYPASV
jgi:hypothetical protein